LDITGVYERFPTEEDCVAYLEEVRWSGVPLCPYCASDRVTAYREKRRHHCKNYAKPISL